MMLIWILALVLAGCVSTKTGAPTAAEPVAAVEVGENSASLSHTVGQTCTEAWRRHGHTNQRDAQAFLKGCLAQQGVIAKQFDPAGVEALLATLVPEGGALTTLVPRDVEAWCPGYAAEDSAGRAVFWRALLTAIVKPESDYVTTASLWELGKLNQFSIGLLQLSFTDAAVYGCEFANEAEIADPRRNLDCGVRIMTRQVRKAGVIEGKSGDNWVGGAAYWSTLRAGEGARGAIQRATMALPECHAG